ncbi:MAG: Ig-like domain-containing protein [Verrucomicrobia bacterium]|nr:Ig-like domain-containing protein [Verrucomicrobiota bacterium]
MNSFDRFKEKTRPDTVARNKSSPWRWLLLQTAVISMTAFTAAYAAAPAAPQGTITGRGYLNIGGTAVSALTADPRFPSKPDVEFYYTYFEWNATGDINNQANNAYGDNYGAQMVGYFYPPSTGDYTFKVCADDEAQLFLSTDENPANKKLIATEQGWSNPRQWDTANGGALEAKNSQTYTGTQWATKDATYGGAKITLQANKAYYIEALFKEGGGGDNLAVAVQDPQGAIDAALPIPGKYLSTIDKTSGPLKILTQPQSASVDEGKAVSFSVIVDGTPPYSYQWKKNGTDIAGETSKTLSINRTVRGDNGAKFAVAVTGAQGSATSADAVLTVKFDTAPPTLVSVAGSASFDYITVTFSEALDPTTAQTAANYKLSGGITVSSATLGAAPGDNKVTLKTSKQSEGATLTLTVSNVKDIGGNTMAANSTINFLTAKFELGWASYERWDNENGDPGAIAAFADSIADASIRPPDYSSAVRQFGAPWGAREYYSARVSGFFIPPSNGNYVFFTSSDDQSNVYLSTDENPANKKLIAQETGWSNQYQWLTANGGTADTKRSDQNAATEWASGATITLQAGKRYYIETLLDEGTGGDGVDVTFIKEGEADPAASTAGMRMRGSVIGTFLDPNGANVTITQQPQDTTGQENRTAKLTVGATGTSAYGSTVNYQWQKSAPGSSTFSDIAGATASSYTTPVLALADSGTKYRVSLSVPTFATQSTAATLTVVPDTFPPKVDGVGTLIKGTAVEIGVRFDESVEKASASVAANYTLSKGTVTGVRYQQFAHEGEAANFVLGTKGPFNGYAVVLTTSGVAAGDNVTVTVKGVKDLKGNAIAAAGEAKSITATQKMKWAAMGGTDYLEGELGGGIAAAPDATLWPDDAIASSAQDFDLISGGTANWNNYDEATFVYEEVTGDFDKVVRVEYHDPTSQWARAGMAATPNADEGVTRAQVNGGYTMAKRYMLRANPAVQWSGSAGNNQFEADWRLTDGGNYGGTGTSTPAYPNAWMRMQRTGQTFTGFYSANGKDWTSYGAQTFTAEPMPDKLLVGIYYSPEMNNNDTGGGVGHSSVAKFRQYGDFKVAGAEPGKMTVALAAGKISISWEGDGTLQSATSVTGPWTDVGSTKPFSAGTTGQAMYFRVKGQ